jgi:hypothetical protein
MYPVTPRSPPASRRASQQEPFAYRRFPARDLAHVPNDQFGGEPDAAEYLEQLRSIQRAG